MTRWVKRLRFGLVLKLGRWVIVVFRDPTATAKKR